jgi:hypothetical protein
MKIFFYNIYNLGDLLFNKSILQTICQSNNNHTLFMISRYNSYLFSDIPNLQHIFFDNIDKTYIDLCNKNNICYFIDNDTDSIFINLWIGTTIFNIISNLTVKDCECNLINQFILTQHIFNHIYSNCNILININYNINEMNSLLPIIPKTDISFFLKWYEINKNHKLIMYFNYTPKSGQMIPFGSHNDIVLHLAKHNPNSYILLPFIPNDLQLLINKLQINNIINCSILFDCIENKSCENISKIIKISEYCDYSIHFDIGACFYYINQNIYNSNNLILHIGINNDYYNSLINNFSQNDQTYMRNYKIKLLLSHNESAIISNIDQYILK